MHPVLMASLPDPQSQNPQNSLAIPAVLSFRIEQIYHKFERLFIQFVSSTFLKSVHHSIPNPKINNYPDD